MRQQLIGKRLELRPQSQRTLQVWLAQRVLFDTDKVQARTGHGVLFEQLPGAEEVKSGTETGFANDQSTAVRQRGEAFTQTVLFEKYVAGFFKA